MNNSQNLALQLAQSQSFLTLAMDEAFNMIAEKTGISKDSLIEQFPKNEKLRESIAEAVALAAKVTAESLSE